MRMKATTMTMMRMVLARSLAERPPEIEVWLDNGTRIVYYTKPDQVTRNIEAESSHS